MKCIRLHLGMTMAELIIVMALLTMVGGLFLQMYVASTRVFQDELARSDLRGDTGVALERLRVILREARALDQITPTSLTVWHDVNTNASREADETLQFSWAGNPGDPLFKIVSGQNLPFLSGVQAFAVTYEATSKVFQVDVTTLRRGTSMSFSSKVQARNL